MPSTLGIVASHYTPPPSLWITAETGVVDSLNNYPVRITGSVPTTTTDKVFGARSVSFPGNTTNYISLTSAKLRQWADQDAYTVQCWVKGTGSSWNDYGNASKLIQQNNLLGSFPWTFGPLTDGSLRLYYWTGSMNLVYTSPGLVSLNTWTHIAFTKNGSTLTLYVNGISVATSNVAGSVQLGPEPLIVGHEVQCLIDDFRIIPGQARVDFSAPPPQLSLLAHADSFADSGPSNHSIINNSGAISSNPIDTTNKKFGTGSFFFDAITSNQGLFIGDNVQDFRFGPTDFTIEFWCKFSQASLDGGGTRTIMSTYPDFSVSNVWRIFVQTDGSIRFRSTENVNLGTTQVINNNLWHHVMFCRVGTNVYTYCDGQLRSTVNAGVINFVSNIGISSLLLGMLGNSGNSRYVGNLDEIRIIKHYAVASGQATYTVPTAPYTTAIP